MVEFSALSTLVAVPLDAPRPSDSATSATRVTPPTQSDGLQSDSRGRSTADRAADARFNGRVAFTAKFGPDPETGLPLQVVRGADVEAAENFDLLAIVARRIAGSLAANSAIDAQEARDRSLAPPSAEEEAATPSVEASEPADSVRIDVERSDADTASGEDSAPTSDFGFARPAPSGDRGAVLDISI